jgi:hypothetical protein
VDDENWRCTDPDPAWTCAPNLYGDGSVCHCGCGMLDMDCLDYQVAACGVCDAPGSCSDQACPGSINLSYNGICSE